MTFQTVAVDLLGERLDSSLAKSVLVEQRDCRRYRDAYGIPLPIGEAWLFDYGVLVCWGVPQEAREQLCTELRDLMNEHVNSVAVEHYSYTINTDEPLKIHNDQISLPVDDTLARLGLSHAFAQSVKLSFFEDRARNDIQQNRFLATELAEKGKISLTRKQLAKLRGVLFATSSDISVNFNLLDTPEFFWDYPEQETYYLALSKYLDLTPRIEILNHKLTTIHEMLDMLASEQHHKHSAFLEWIIIILIAIDILIYFSPK